MLIPLRQLIQKHTLKITGVIHAGAHFGQEIQDYKRCNIKNIVLIEPCQKAYNVLTRTYHNRYPVHKCALGSQSGKAVMNVETKNNGQSNSILKPKKHLEQFPDITFNDTETVEMKTLDSLNIQHCNMLNMDVQGYELEVLKGASATIENLDYIYTEVNRDEVYENCAQVSEIDNYLKAFDRVETSWSGGTWGDALYIRKKKIISVPDEFMPHVKYNYPPDNDLIFEEWYSQNAKESEQGERYYLPVHWTSYYVNNRYGKHENSIKKLQRFINSLNKENKYYTIIQYDDGILNDLSGIDVKVFSMSGHGEPLPLVSQPHKFEFNSEKKYLANFIGKNTHPIRSGIFKINDERFYISEKNHSLQDYCKILSESVFTLCPRGYGKSSFRIQEALQYGSIPVYISDEFVLPYAFYNYGITLLDVENISEALTKYDGATPEMLKRYYQELFTYSAVKKYIESKL